MESAAVGVGKSVLNCLLSGAKAAMDADTASKQDVERDLPFLRGELAAMQSFLVAADGERNKHKDVKRVRNLALDVEDCLQDVTVHLRSNWGLAHTMRERQRIAQEMKRLRAQIEQVDQTNLRYHIAQDVSKAVSATTNNNRDRARRAATSDKPEVKLMVQMINNGNEDVRVVAVWGTSANLEQTSVIRAAYENPHVKEKYQCRAWVRVLQPFNPKEFVQSLVRQFHAAVGVGVLLEPERTAEELAQEFNRHVGENAYLIVLNDLNTIEEWDRIKTCFSNNKKGSRIIVSTKQSEVASLCVGYGCATLKLKELSTDQILYAFYDKGSQDGTNSAEAGSSSNVVTTGVNNSSHKNILTRMETLVAASLEESWFIGRRSEKYEITKLVSNKDVQQLRVISLWGMGGIGKTTLVRDIYQSDEISGMFDKERFQNLPP